jgi:transposase
MTDTLFAERKLAIMQIKQGKTQKEVAQNLNRSSAWVAKWYKRFKRKGWQGLKEESRAPKNHGKRIDAAVRTAICQARLEIEAEAALGEGLKYRGAQAIRTRLKQKVKPLPSVPTIERVLREAGLTHPRVKATEPEMVYPHLQPTAPHQHHQVDIVPHYLQGGERISCFNAIDVVSRYPTGLALAQHRAQDATAFLVHLWQEMGIADYTQVDNEGCFSGGATHPYVLGQVVRLALTVGTELVFSPVYHPQSNCFVERFHQDYNQHVWEDTYLVDIAAVNQKGLWFFPLYCLREDHDKLHRQSPAVLHQENTPRQLPADFTLSGKKLPLREGRIHFIRRVSPQGQVRVLNVDWNVPRFDPLQGVWVTIEFRTTGALLSIFDAAPDARQRDCLATYAFPLNEPVLPLTNTADTTTETETPSVQCLQSQQTAELTQTTITEFSETDPASSTLGQVSTLPPLTLIPWNNNLFRRSSRLTGAILQHAARLTRQVVSTMY